MDEAARQGVIFWRKHVDSYVQFLLTRGSEDVSRIGWAGILVAFPPQPHAAEFLAKLRNIDASRYVADLWGTVAPNGERTTDALYVLIEREQLRTLLADNQAALAKLDAMAPVAVLEGHQTSGTMPVLIVAHEHYTLCSIAMSLMPETPAPRPALPSRSITFPSRGGNA